MKLGFLYAGQGSQHVGMGQDLYVAYSAFQKIFDHVSPGFDLKTACFEDPDGVLNETQITQPCMVAFAAGLTAILREAGIAPTAVAGLSLGEYAALHAAGVFDAATAIHLAAFRGKAMQEAVAGLDCSMMAVLGLSREPLLAACQEASTLGVVEIANYNCPGQMVIGGETAAVNRAAALAKENGAKRCMPLRVSGPFHTSLLKPAGDALRKYLKSSDFLEPQIPVIFNCLGTVKSPTDTIPALLERQVKSSVYLEDSIRSMASLGVDTVVEIGPGKVLSGFVRKTAPELTVYSVETAADVESLLTVLRG